MLYWLTDTFRYITNQQWFWVMAMILGLISVVGCLILILLPESNPRARMTGLLVLATTLLSEVIFVINLFIRA